jgi:hypothetical protein
VGALAQSAMDVESPPPGGGAVEAVEWAKGEGLSRALDGGGRTTGNPGERRPHFYKPRGWDR